MVMGRVLSAPVHKYDGIRLPMHPGSPCCSARQERWLLALLAPCDPGASTFSMRHRIYEQEHKGIE